MTFKKVLTYFLLLVLFVVLIYVINYVRLAAPILTGYGAKNLCSCVFVGEREKDSVIEHELGGFPQSLGTYEVNMQDSSATASVFGIAFRKAVYRKGFGCTLLSEITEEEFRNQKFTRPSAPLVDQDTIEWPMGNLPDSTFSSGNYDMDRLAKAVDDAFAEPTEKKKRQTRAILVVHDGNIIAEKYADGFTEDSKQIGWSMTKSVINALIGIQVKNGNLSLLDRAPILEWQMDDRKSITIDNLMQMSSGLQWEENYASPSDATNMLFKSKDAGLFAIQSPLESQPGEVFEYSSGTTNILSMILRQNVGEDKYHAFPYEELFHKIGMYSVVMEPDPSGSFVGSSYSYATARDWARFGLLFLNDGFWISGERILPEGWVEYSSQPAKGAKRGEYGAQFWLNAGEAGNPSNRFYPDVPEDLFWADGFEGQNIFIIPSMNLIVVKLSQSSGDYLDDNKFLSEVIAALGE